MADGHPRGKDSRRQNRRRSSVLSSFAVYLTDTVPFLGSLIPMGTPSAETRRKQRRKSVTALSPEARGPLRAPVAPRTAGAARKRPREGRLSVQFQDHRNTTLEVEKYIDKLSPSDWRKRADPEDDDEPEDSPTSPPYLATDEDEDEDVCVDVEGQSDLDQPQEQPQASAGSSASKRTRQAGQDSAATSAQEDGYQEGLESAVQSAANAAASSAQSAWGIAPPSAPQPAATSSASTAPQPAATGSVFASASSLLTGAGSFGQASDGSQTPTASSDADGMMPGMQQASMLAEQLGATSQSPAPLPTPAPAPVDGTSSLSLAAAAATSAASKGTADPMPWGGGGPLPMLARQLTGGAVELADTQPQPPAPVPAALLTASASDVPVPMMKRLLTGGSDGQEQTDAELAESSTPASSPGYQSPAAQSSSGATARDLGLRIRGAYAKEQPASSSASSSSSSSSSSSVASASERPADVNLVAQHLCRQLLSRLTRSSLPLGQQPPATLLGPRVGEPGSALTLIDAPGSAFVGLERAKPTVSATATSSSSSASSGTPIAPQAIRAVPPSTDAPAGNGTLAASSSPFSSVPHLPPVAAGLQSPVPRRPQRALHPQSPAAPAEPAAQSVDDDFSLPATVDPAAHRTALRPKTPSAAVDAVARAIATAQATLSTARGRFARPTQSAAKTGGTKSRSRTRRGLFTSFTPGSRISRTHASRPRAASELSDAKQVGNGATAAWPTLERPEAEAAAETDAPPQAAATKSSNGLNGASSGFFGSVSAGPATSAGTSARRRAARNVQRDILAVLQRATREEAQPVPAFQFSAPQTIDEPAFADSTDPGASFAFSPPAKLH